MVARFAVTNNTYRYGFNGKEHEDDINAGGGDYDFGARIYDSRIARWLAVDPLALKYPYESPYDFCLNNPVTFVDRDGREVRPVGGETGEAFRAILNTLPPEARCYVVIDPKTGLIDRNELLKYKNESGSSNFEALKTLVMDSKVVNVHVVKKINYTATDKGQKETGLVKDMGSVVPGEKFGDPDYTPSTGESGNLGFTLPSEEDAAADAEAQKKSHYISTGTNEIDVFINEGLSTQGKAEVAAHELYGHALFEIVKKDFGHKFKDNTDTNTELKKQITKSVDEAAKNVGSPIKK